MRELKIGTTEAGQRFDKYLKKYFSEAPGSFVYKMLRKKNIVLNGKKAEGSEIIREGDLVKMFLADETIDGFRKTNFSQHAAAETFSSNHIMKMPEPNVVFEDDDLLLVSKPADLLSQGDKSGRISLVEILNAYVRKQGNTSGETFRASPANRLDRNTSGLVLCGKSIRGMQFLSEMIRRHDLGKQYLVVVRGSMKESGIRKVWYTKDVKENRVHLTAEKVQGSELMITGFTPVEEAEGFTLVLVDLLTGKPHQIRAHLSYLGYPVAGDPKYGDPKLNRILAERYKIRRQMLHSAAITFPENIVDEHFRSLAGKKVTAPLPSDFSGFIRKLGMTADERFFKG